MATNQVITGFDPPDQNQMTQDVISSDAFESLLSKLDVEAAALGLAGPPGNVVSSLPMLEQTSFAGIQPSGFDFAATSLNTATTPHDTMPSGVYSPSSHGSGLVQTESEANSVVENKDLEDLVSTLRAIERPFPPPKIGARFSQKSTRVLNQWLAGHPAHPYPTGEDIEVLRAQTGLSKTQISNWLSNARRRGKVGGGAAGKTKTKPVDIPQTASPRPGTPAPRRAMRDMNPMERWVESPPENEPASFSDIARAVARGSDSGMVMPVVLAL